MATARSRGGRQPDLAYQPDRALGVPSDADITTPMLSRIHNHILGGGHSFGVDRAAADGLMAAIPAVRPTVWAARAFLRRAVVDLAARRIEQFLDIGCGIPTLGATHEILTRSAPEARVVYVDHDPVAVLTARGMCAAASAVAVLHGNLREPESILDQIRGTAAALLDLSRPVGLILGGVLACLTDIDAYPAVTHLANAVAPGSFLVLTHPTPRLLAQAPPQAVRSATAILARAPMPLRLRAHADVARFFDGWTLTSPGLVNAAAWRPDPDTPARATNAYPTNAYPTNAYPTGAVLAGVAGKPRGLERGPLSTSEQPR